MSDRKERIKPILEMLTASLPGDAVQKRPFFPDLLNQPDLVVVPEPGKLIALFTYELKKSVSWRTALGCFEDLAEVKINVGDYSVVVALTFAEFDDFSVRDDIAQLLHETFDGFYFPNEWKPHLGEERFTRFVMSTSIRRDLSQFWTAEREQSRVSLERFNTERYSAVVEKEQGPEMAGRGEHELAMRIKKEHGVQVVRDHLVPNIKGALVDLPKHYSFEFDLGVVGHEDIAIEFLSTGRNPRRERIRTLMAMGRLLRYQLDGGRLYPRARPFRPVLIVDGNIAGPDHDPYRYVRALLSTGWEILRLDQLDRLGELI